jgi:hypothetical protein
MVGVPVKSSFVFCSKAVASLPERWSCLEDSFRKASKMPKVEGPIRIENHAEVFGYSSARKRPLRKKLSTSASFPGFASNRTNSPTLTIYLTPFRMGMP